MRSTPPDIMVFYNTMWAVYNFRRSLLKELMTRGYKVIVFAPFDGYEKKFFAMGITCVNFPFTSKTTDPIHDGRLFLRFLRTLRRVRPRCLLCFTIKPNIYGSAAARLAGVPVINNITGLGSAFLQRGPLPAVVRLLYKIALRRSRCVFFQNDEDREVFVRNRLVRRSQSRRIPGSGVDTSAYAPRPHAPCGRVVFLLIGRLIRDKGVIEYAAAAESLASRVPGAVCRLLGEIDADNPTAVGRTTVERWVRSGVIEYLGVTDDVRPFIAESDCVVLPSYREGLSRTLLEAAAMAKPLVAADVPGCREVVEDGRTGLLCRVRDARDLSDKMAAMASLPPAEREAMGLRGRGKIEREFDEKIVIHAYIEAIEEAISDKSGKEIQS
ncbi:MAG: glycosyltransferase family 4 protein [Spirochaetales bacterium]|nr:glycosyltransferase family 4 protein [Spirochaetales bacterium]